jgi:PAS domain S-box-containing protein
MEDRFGLYESIIYSAPDIITITDPRGNILFASPNALKLFGGNAETDFTEHNLLEYIDPEDHERAINNISLMLEGTLTGPGEYTAVKANGKKCRIEVNGMVALDADGKPYQMIFITRDVTDRKDAEAKVRKSMEDYQFLVENINDAIFKIDDKGIIEYISPSISKLTGLTADEVTGKSFLMFVGENRNRLLERLNMLEKDVEISGEYQIVTKAGEHKWIRISTKSLFRDGKFTGGTGTIVDINEKKDAELSLRKSEERLRNIIDQTQTVIWEVDKDGLYTYISPLAETTWGYRPEEIIGKKYFYDFHPEEGRESFITAAQKIFSRKEKINNLPNRILCKDGSIIWVTTNGIPLTDTAGNLTGYLGSDNSIDNWKKAEQALMASEKELKTAQEIAGIGNWEFDFETGNTHWSENLFRLFGLNGYSNPVRFNTFTELVHPEDRHLIDKAMDEIIRTKESLNIELRLLLPDNSLMWIQNNIVPVIEGDKIKGLKGVNIDITAKKTTEQKISEQNEKLNAIISAIPDLIFIIEKGGTLREFYTSRPEDLYIPPEKIIGINISDVFGEAASALHLKNLDEALSTNKLTSYVYALPDVTGEKFFESRMAPLGSDTVLALVRDITDSTKAEKEIKSLNATLEQRVAERTAQLEAASKAKSEFLASMSHEIRTPMNSILGYSELLENTLSDTVQRNYLESIKSSGRTLLTLINDILDISKIEAGRMNLDYDYIGTSSFFREFEKIFSYRLTEKGLKYVAEISENTPPYIFIDGTRLRQIILNLLGNAIKFTEKGEVRLKVTTLSGGSDPSPADGRERESDIMIEVSDTGIGIPEDFRKDIFNPFTQVKSRTSHSGTGLGLAITQRLVTMMHGTLEMHSELGKGTIFTVRIPGIKFLVDYDIPAGDKLTDPLLVEFEKSVVLIADNEVGNRNLIKDFLTGTALTVVEAADGSEAFEKISRILPDAVISDIRMPGLSGFELLDKLKSDKKTSDIPVIAYSASVMKDEQHEILKRNFCGLLRKPVSKQALFNELTKILPYRIIEKSVEISIADKTDRHEEEITEPEKLLAELEGQLYSVWKTFELRQPLGEVKKFGTSLVTLGEEHNSSLISGYGQALTGSTESFNVEMMMKLLRRYPENVEILKKATRS